MSRDPGAGEVAAALQLGIGLCLRWLRQLPPEGGLTLPEASVLKRLAQEGPATVTELARAEQISVQSVGATLSTLEARGLLERRSDPADGRRAILSATPAGRKALRHQHDARTELLTSALATGFSAAELRQLMAAAPLIERLGQSL
jgi:DNA-binding MarR family transcriptional regulator